MKSKIYLIFKRLFENPPAIIGISFAIVICIGTILLNSTYASLDGEKIGIINALFTACSATCVTGLTVVNTTLRFTVFGKIVILMLIQIGGLGTMVIFSMFSMIIGKRIGLKERLLIKEQLNTDSMSGIVKLSKNVIKISFIIEFIGMCVFLIKFYPLFGLRKGLFFSLFHSISAFCNAGFDILGDSIRPFNGDLLINVNIMILVILGGLGFGVFLDIYNNRKFRNLSINSKMVLIISSSLLIMGAILFFVIEKDNPLSLGGYSLKDKVLISSFQSTISRTAGFYSTDISLIRDSTAFLIIILMFIGGSPASTAGGLKTTTFGILIFSVISILKGDREIVFMKRTIPKNTIYKALAITCICLAVVLCVSLCISVVEDDRFKFLDILFESVSAFGTVGLTRGITPELSNISKVVLSITMFLGRVGPATLAIGIMRKKTSSTIRYANGNIMVG